MVTRLRLFAFRSMINNPSKEAENKWPLKYFKVKKSSFPQSYFLPRLIIESPTSLTLVGPPTLTHNNSAIQIEGTTDVWNDRFLKQLATAKIKQQWGNNLKKFEGIQMPGGVTLNGQKIYDEASEEIKEMEEQIYQMGSLPSEIFTG